MTFPAWIKENNVRLHHWTDIANAYSFTLILASAPRFLAAAIPDDPSGAAPYLEASER